MPPAHEYFGDACEKKGMLHEAITQWGAALTLNGQPEHARVLEESLPLRDSRPPFTLLAQSQLEDLDRKRLQGDWFRLRTMSLPACAAATLIRRLPGSQK